MKTRLLLLAGLALILSANPALAFKNIEGSDIVTFAAKDGPMAFAPAQWQAYRDAVVAALAAYASEGPDPRALAARIVEAQRNLLAALKADPAYQAYLAGDDCRILVKLDMSAVDTLIDEAAKSLSGDAAKALRDVIKVSLTQIDNIERSARFRSLKDRTLFAAAYYNFVAATVLVLLPPDRQGEVTLASFGETVSCKEAGRTA